MPSVNETFFCKVLKTNLYWISQLLDCSISAKFMFKSISLDTFCVLSMEHFNFLAFFFPSILFVYWLMARIHPVLNSFYLLSLISFLLSNSWFLFPLYRWYRCTNPNFVGILVFEAVVFSSSEVHEPLYVWFILYSYTQWIFFTLFLTVAIQLSSKSVSGKMRPLF